MVRMEMLMRHRIKIKTLKCYFKYIKCISISVARGSKPYKESLRAEM